MHQMYVLSNEEELFFHNLKEWILLNDPDEFDASKIVSRLSDSESIDLHRIYKSSGFLSPSKLQSNSELVHLSLELIDDVLSCSSSVVVLNHLSSILNLFRSDLLLLNHVEDMILFRNQKENDSQNSEANNWSSNLFHKVEQLDGELLDTIRDLYMQSIEQKKKQATDIDADLVKSILNQIAIHDGTQLNVIYKPNILLCNSLLNKLRIYRTHPQNFINDMLYVKSFLIDEKSMDTNFSLHSNTFSVDEKAAEDGLRINVTEIENYVLSCLKYKSLSKDPLLSKLTLLFKVKKLKKIEDVQRICEDSIVLNGKFYEHIKKDNPKFKLIKL